MSTKKKALLASVIGSAIVLGAALSAPAMAAAEEGSLSAVSNEGREVTVNGKKFKVSSSRTKVMIAGKAAKRDQLKDGLNCKVEGDDEASMIDCK